MAVSQGPLGRDRPNGLEVSMELKELTKKVLDLFEVSEAINLPDAIRALLSKNDIDSKFDAYIELCPDLDIDYMQKIYQFYCADRKEKKQDYTPVVLSKMVACITPLLDGIVYDCCAGSGSLTIQKWAANKNHEYILDELDDNVIPILLFNLCIRNIKALVRQRNILTGEVFNSYHVIPGDKYARVQKDMFPYVEDVKSDIAVSNPPFNLKENICEDLLQTAPPKCTCNFAFIENCLRVCKRFCAVILPNGCTTSKSEELCRKHYLEKGWLRAVIQLPDKMFESTSVATCIFLFDKNKKTKDVMLVDATKMGCVEVREQRGEGDSSHYNRIYKKEFNSFTDVQINAVAGLALGAQSDRYSQIVNEEELKDKGYNMTLPVYLPIEIGHTVHRDFNAIIQDINRIKCEKNKVKVVVNKVWAERLGLQDIILLNKQNNEVTKEINNSLSLFKNYTFKDRLIDDNYIRESASKELRIENTDKEYLSSLMQIFFPMFRQHIYYLNEEENRLLIELRDSMLPYLMSGELEMVYNDTKD